jgi:hypothetical protein
MNAPLNRDEQIKRHERLAATWAKDSTVRSALVRPASGQKTTKASYTRRDTVIARCG